jgi:hypothetical protein
MKQTTIAATLISVLVLVAAAVSADARSFTSRSLEFDVDHFKCYRTEFINLSDNPILQPFVTLEDEFDKALGISEAVEVFVHLRFCNPVTKRYGGVVTGDPLLNDKAHLTLYHFNPDPEEKPIRGGVTVLNQFGRQKLKIDSARILAVPTAKNLIEPTSTLFPQFPEQAEFDLTPLDEISHYKCYYATGNGPDPIPAVFLADQFEKVSHQLLTPVLFCNPVVKVNADGKRFEIQTKDHLTCYNISIATEQPKFAQIVNQFIPTNVNMVARAGDILCVPSKMVAFDLHPTSITAAGRRDECRPRGGVADCKTNEECGDGGICQNVDPDCICVNP